MHLKKFALSAAGSLLLVAAMPAAQALDIEVGDWTFMAAGSVNANYVYTSCGNNGTTFTGLGGNALGACNSNGAVGSRKTSNIRTGLLPGQLILGARTTQNGWDISGTFGLYPGIVSNDGGSPNLAPSGNVGLGTTGLDIRQVFLTFGNSEFGTIKAGRDFGIFGFDAIINDMSIPAVGGASLSNGSPGNTTIGSIGFGYVYTDTLSQINYTTPSFNGTTLTVGVVQTIDSLSSSRTLGIGETEPGFQWQIKHAWESGFVTFNGLTMTVDGVPKDASNPASDTSEKRVWGMDLNWKQNFGPIDILLSGYYTDGLGSVAMLFDSFDATGSTRNSYGGLAQVAYTVGKNKFGLNYGASYLDDNGVDPANLFKSNRKVTAGYYYSLTANLLLTAEYTHATSTNHMSDKVGADNINVGAFFSF